MLDKISKKTNDKPCNTIDTLVGATTELKGDIVFSGGLRIDGKVKGDIVARGEDNSTLVLSENASVVGDVAVPHMVVNGKIKGNVRCAERLELQQKAEIIGDVTYKTLEISAGAVVNGAFIRDAGKTSATVTHLKAVDGARPDGADGNS